MDLLKRILCLILLSTLLLRSRRGAETKRMIGKATDS